MREKRKRDEQNKALNEGMDQADRGQDEEEEQRKQ